MNNFNAHPADSNDAWTADVLIIGSGLAGLMLALRLQEQGSNNTGLKVTLVSKGALSDSNSSWAQGGVAAFTGANPFDSPDAHLIDTIKSGAGLTDVDAARGIVFSGQRLIAELDRLGVAFDKNPGGKLDLALEGGHKQARVVHSKDTTGKSITEALTEKLLATAATNLNLVVLENTCAVDLLMLDGICRGARLLSAEDTFEIRAKHTVLATGGLGQIFERTTNPEVATADGVALAYRAGAVLRDMEFVQFHPTALKLDGAPAFLISEAARGAGATLLDHKGQRFVKRYHEDGELATRDIVSRAIHAVMSENDLANVFLDMRPIGEEKIREHFPNILRTCGQYGIDILNEPVPVAPAAHYMMGGIKTDLNGHTSVSGLYAIGECACTGLHGANRLASNSLLEAGAMALLLGDELLQEQSLQQQSQQKSSRQNALPQKSSLQEPALKSPGPTSSFEAPILLPFDLQNFRNQMYRYAGLVRSPSGLSILLNAPSQTLSADTKLTVEQCSARNIFQIGQLIALAALHRKESRGGHLRSDFPSMDDANFLRHLDISRKGIAWDETASVESSKAASTEETKTTASKKSTASKKTTAPRGSKAAAEVVIATISPTAKV